jgi:hypothetical protein
MPRGEVQTIVIAITAERLVSWLGILRVCPRLWGAVPSILRVTVLTKSVNNIRLSADVDGHLQYRLPGSRKAFR